MAPEESTIDTDVPPNDVGNGNDVLPAVRKAMTSPDPRMRQRAIHVAAWKGDSEALPILKGMTPAGREFLGEALTAMGCADRVDEIKSVPDLIDFDEGRIE